MPAFVYSGMQYARIASYYFAQVRKKLPLLRSAARARNIVPKEKTPKMGTISEVWKVGGRADARNLPGLAIRYSR
jgi:hypothetical protein